MVADTLHLTLVFVGAVPVGRLGDMMHLAGDLSVLASTLSLDQAHCWRHNRIACLEAQLIPDGLARLVGGLEVGLDKLGIRYDRRSYRPHVTLVRNANCAGRGGQVGVGVSKEAGGEIPAPDPLIWPVRDFVLLRSRLRPDGARYDILGRWPLVNTNS